MSFIKLRRAVGVAALAALTGTGALALAAPASAVGPQTRYVATNGSDGTDPVNDCTVLAKPCKTIQHALDEANDGDTVQVAAGTYAENVGVSKSVTIAGASNGATTITGSSNTPSVTVGTEAPITATLSHLSISGNSTAYGLAVASGATVTLSDSKATSNEIAGAIVAQAGTLHISRSHLDGNAGAGVLVVGGSVTMADSTASDNVSSNPQDNSPFVYGVAVLSGSVSIERSTLAGNGLGGLYVIAGGLGLSAVSAPAAAPQSVVHVAKSTISGNGAIGVANGPGGVVTVSNSTVSGNHGAGVYAEGSSTTVTSSTVADTSDFPSGAHLPSSTQSGGLVYLAQSPALRSTAKSVFDAPAQKLEVAGKTVRLAPAAARPQAAAPNLGITVTSSVLDQQAGTADCNGAVTDGGYNLSSDAANSCKFTAAAHSITKTAARIGALADNGGPTLTEKPLKGSPAIDGVASGKAGCVSGATDQRGASRPQPTGGACDIGAVELAAKAIVIHPDSLPHGTVDAAYNAILSATGGAYPTYVWSLAPGSSLPDGLSLSSTGHITGTPTKAGTYSVTVSVNDPVLKRYTIVIDAATGTNGNGSEPISATGAPVESMTAVAAGSIFAGFLLMVGAGLIGRRPGRHRVRS